MKQVSVHIAYDNQFPDFITLRVEGEIRIGTLEPIEKSLENLYPVCQGKKVLFDLTEVNFVSSIGWSLFLAVSKRIIDKGGRFLLTGMNAEVQNAFELLDFQEFMENYPTPAEAFQEALEEELFQGRRFPPQRIGFF
jgi:anti-anti-sigma factor